MLFAILITFSLQGCTGEDGTLFVTAFTVYTVSVLLAGMYLRSLCIKRSPKDEENKKKSEKKQGDEHKPAQKTTQISEDKLDTYLERMTVEILSSMLKRTHAKSTGIKEDLIRRVVQEVKAVRPNKEK